MRRYQPSTIYRYMDLPSTQISKLTTHTDITPPQTFRPWPKPPPTPPTPPQTHTHSCPTPLPPVSIGVAEPKPNPCIHNIAPLTSHTTRDKLIHISHTLPTPLIPRTTFIPSTSAGLNTIPESRVPPTYEFPALTATTLAPSSTSALPPLAHSLSILTSNTNNSTRITRIAVIATTAPTTQSTNTSSQTDQGRPHDYTHHTSTMTQQ